METDLQRLISGREALRGMCQWRRRVLDRTFERQDDAIALPENSDLREAINREILEILRGDDWQRLLKRYLDN